MPRQRRRRRKKIEIEAERAAKRRNLMEMVAQLRESHAAADPQNQAIDLTKVLLITASVFRKTYYKLVVLFRFFFFSRWKFTETSDFTFRVCTITTRLPPR